MSTETRSAPDGNQTWIESGNPNGGRDEILGPFEILVTGALREFAIQKLPEELRAILTNDAPVICSLPVVATRSALSSQGLEKR